MRIRRFGAAGVAIAAGALVLAGCSTPQSEVVEDSTVTVAWNQPFYSYNGNTSFGNATANNNIIYSTNSWFNYYNDVPELVKDESFGTYELVSEDPLVVTYTVNEGVTWSDGTPVDAGDLLLVWAANSGVLNTPDFDASEFTDPDTGEFTEDFPTDIVFFDGAIGAGLERVTETPELGDDGRSITLTYDSLFVDWELAFPQGLPAHVVAKNALGIEDNAEAEDALIAAIQENDTEALAAISSFWNTGFNFSEMPTDPELVLATGPYIITDFVADQYIELSANEAYTGDNTPQVETVTVRFIPDPLAAVQALENGEVDIIQPQATADVADALAAIDGITVLGGYEGTYEHLDLVFENSKSGHFSNPLIREAFLKVVPRQQIVDNLIVPLQPDAEVRNSQLFLPGADGYDETVEGNGMAAQFAEVDVEGAKALLAEAGVTNPEVCILYATNNPRRVNEFALIQASAAEAGFNVTDCGSPQWGGLLGTPNLYDATFFGWQSTSLGVTNSSATFKTGGINNLNFYSNPEVDALLEELDVTFDPEAQIELQLQIDKLLMDDYYGVTIFQFPSTAAYSDRVANVSPSTLAPTIFWNIWEWEPTESNVVEE